jgi:hypothetical protein
LGRSGVRRAGRARRFGSSRPIAATSARNLGGVPLALVLHIRFAMKRSTRKLALHVQTIRKLDHEALEHVSGGNPQPEVRGFIMKDTIIIRTGG